MYILLINSLIMIFNHLTLLIYTHVHFVVIFFY